MAAIRERDTCYDYTIAGMKLKHIMGCRVNGFSALLGSWQWGVTEGGCQNGMEMVTKVLLSKQDTQLLATIKAAPGKILK